MIAKLAHIVSALSVFELEGVGLASDVEVMGRLTLVVALTFHDGFVAEGEGVLVAQRIELLLCEGLAISALEWELNYASKVFFLFLDR